MNRREKLLAWVKTRHEGQLIKRSKNPYLQHLINVAEMADVMPLAYETGLCHDLLEKTKVTSSKLQTILSVFGYTHAETDHITQGVTELTDVFTKAAYPKLSKSERKEKEAARLITTGSLAQTVKYADLMDNTDWMLSHDLSKVRKYLLQKRLLLQNLTMGVNNLRDKAIQKIDTAIKKISQESD